MNEKEKVPYRDTLDERERKKFDKNIEWNKIHQEELKTYLVSFERFFGFGIHKHGYVLIETTEIYRAQIKILALDKIREALKEEDYIIRICSIYNTNNEFATDYEDD